MENDLSSGGELERTLAAIVFTDVVNYSERMSRDELKTLELVRRDLSWIAQVADYYQGRVLKNTGDGLLMVFSSVHQAFECAYYIQKCLLEMEQSTPATERLEHRIGLHMGDCFFSESDVLGDGVNVAARLMSIADPNTFCVSEVVYNTVRPTADIEVIDRGTPELKHITYPVRVYQISHRRVPRTTPPPPTQDQAHRPKRGPDTEQLSIKPKAISTSSLTQSLRIVKFKPISPRRLSAGGHYPSIYALVRHFATPIFRQPLQDDMATGTLIFSPHGVPSFLAKATMEDNVIFHFFASGSATILQVDTRNQPSIDKPVESLFQQLLSRPLQTDVILPGQVDFKDSTRPPSYQPGKHGPGQ